MCCIPIFNIKCFSGFLHFIFDLHMLRGFEWEGSFSIFYFLAFGAISDGAKGLLLELCSWSLLVVLRDQMGCQEFNWGQPHVRQVPRPIVLSFWSFCCIFTYLLYQIKGLIYTTLAHRGSKFVGRHWKYMQFSEWMFCLFWVLHAHITTNAEIYQND